MTDSQKYEVKFYISFNTKAAAIRALEQVAREKRAAASARSPSDAKEFLDSARELENMAIALACTGPAYDITSDRERAL